MTSWWRRYDEPRQVEVRHDDGRWIPGLASGWTFAEGGWRCHVTYTAAVGSTFLRAVDPDHVREIAPRSARCGAP
ncbi:hypothetical protein GCM10027451_29510 [Geodermatophilus aquaeductus]|uniref:Uncharacterized protein n=1 Tax=Geodermatophilus aquaeductus TaxID=1564161 RepID=A0A521F4Q6_9ACTN|nr:hypothetical protein [Geodermatophilus aquaeductus]SMO91139.1 hypothetical protein SAMN06273567_10715 [Geodermatophilus aquaeductus]